MTEAADRGRSRPKAIGSGRCGRARAALRRALADAREAGRLTLEDEVRAVLAERIAALVDDHAGSGDGAAMLRASGELLSLLDTLPIRSERSTGEGGSGDGGSDRARLLTLMDSPAQVGDTAHP